MPEKEKKEKDEMVVEDVGDGMVKISPKSNVLVENKEEFYTEIGTKSEKDFAEEIGTKTLELWRAIIKYSIKRNAVGKKQINTLRAFCDQADVTFAVMRTLKEQLLKGAIQIDKHMMATLGKSLGLVESIDKCIKIISPEDMANLISREKKKQSYVA